MRIRLPFAGVFVLLCLAAGYAGLTPLQLDTYVNDKLLHLATFFLLTLAFYWIVDTNRRRTLNLTLVVCTLCLGCGSEFLQALLPNGRQFDVYDVVANVVGSLAALGLCSWYHKRMLERRRARKTYTAVPGEDDVGGEDDLELGESAAFASVAAAAAAAPQEEGVVETNGAAGGQRGRTLEDEVDNWDENAEDVWDEADGGDVGDAMTGAGKGKEPELHDPKKRTD